MSGDAQDREVPTLIDEVGMLRAEVAAIESMADRWSASLPLRRTTTAQRERAILLADLRATMEAAR